ncbi:helix-turn-helix domain-containing protein [Marinifilum sp. D714]|uniref:helix-turn-helix domain-containing protein n=1 Tax=Marinifilum sp. D714 TaxID=2937523 RepID=UPI0027C47833|nr:helix-turn-helix domain-containing protein [Marinifilum sp. D714]MDQ2178817.1 helix-turn-helix domain-containing protein [Marinifilum sp. D714]
MSKNEMIEASFIGSALFDANNVCMSVEQCAEFLGIHEKTVKNRIKTKDTNKKIIARPYGKGWKIPKIQFVKEIVTKFENQKHNESI